MKHYLKRIIYLVRSRRQYQVATALLIICAGIGLAAWFLWYPLLTEGRLGRIARVRRKVIVSAPIVETVIRKVLFLPAESDMLMLNREMTAVISAEIDKDFPQEEPAVRRAAVALILGLRPKEANIAFPVDPRQTPVETANDPEILHQVIEVPTRRQARNLIVWRYLQQKSITDLAEMVTLSNRNLQSRQRTGSMNPLVAAEKWLRQRQLTARAIAAHGLITSNLKAGNGVVMIRLNPQAQQWDPNVSVVDVKSKRFSSFYLDRLRMEFSTKPTGQLQLYKDTDEDGKLSTADRLIGDFQPRVDSSQNDAAVAELELDDINQMIYAAMEIPTASGVDPYFGTPMFDSDATTRFFIRASDPDALASLMDVKVKFSNAITDERVDPERVQFIDDNTNRFRSDTIMLPEDFVSKWPQFILEPSGSDRPTAVLPAGSYTFSQMVIVPETVKLKIMPGARLRFMPGVSLVSYAPLDAQGTASSPILFTSATGAPWGALVVVNTKSAQSIVRFVTVEEAAPATVNGITISGGLAAHYADIEIYDSIFRRNHGDDGVNVKYSQTTIERNLFVENEFDGLDLDVNRGIARQNEFIGNGNDGLDVSWNEVVIEENVMKNNGDKCLSIGEKSQAPVKRNVFEGCPAGVAVKDSSSVLLEQNIIRGNKQGIVAYQKKEIFSGGIATLKDNQLMANEQDTWADEVSKIVW